VIFGKTNTPEFGITGTTEGRLFGACRNPWSLDHIAGGSSGGAASEVASGMLPLAHASDGMGSIRIPASCCGLFGLKTSRDRNPWWPEDVMRTLPLSVHHCVSRSVRDSAALLDATGFAETRAPWAPPPKQGSYLDEVSARPTRLRVAFTTARPDGRPLHPEVKAAVEDTARLLESLGHTLEERALPIDQQAAPDEVSTAVSDLLRTKGRLDASAPATLEIVITDFRLRSWASAFWLGAMAGADRLGVEVRVQKDGETLKQYRTDTSSVLGGIAYAGTGHRFDRLVKTIAKRIVDGL